MHPVYLAARAETRRITIKALIFGLVCGGIVLYVFAPEWTKP